MLAVALPIDIIPRLQRFQFSLAFTQGVALGYYISRLWRCGRGVLTRSITRVFTRASPLPVLIR